MSINEEFELNNINTNSDDETDYCCICINTFEDEFIKLQCCNQFIHKNCIMEFITSINNNIYKCPICRTQIDISVSFGKIIDYLNENPELISKDKIQCIIKTFYKDIPIKDLFNRNESESEIESEEIKHLKDTIRILTIKKDKFLIINIFLSIPLILIFTIYLFNNYKF